MTTHSTAYIGNAQAASVALATGIPTVKDPNLKVESVTEGLTSPTSMVFIDNNNILVLEKDGHVRLVSNGQLQQQPVFTMPVDSKNERGLLGIAIMKGNLNDKGSINNNSTAEPWVFLYFTESQGGKLVGNKVYRYEFNGQTLVNPTLILDLPATPGTNHQGGKLKIGPDKYLYAVIGELQRNGQLQNIKDGPPPDDSGVIFRVNPNDGSPAPNNPFSTDNKDSKLGKYYAYGIRNSFGLAFDPVSGILWDTENGDKTYDEINLVKPGFNSGWKKVMGPIARSNITEDELVNFQGSKYKDPVFSWLKSIGITDIEFLNSSKLGERYTNNIFVGDITSGSLYYFNINKDRTGLEFDNSNQTGLSDMVADNKQEISKITFGTNFGGITDIVTGPDGFLYVLSFGNGTIYKIVSTQ
jgi:aldose sugar dehydrogenase